MSGCVAESGWRHPGLGSGPRHLGRSNEPRTALCWQNVAHSRDCENEATQPDWTAGCAARCLSGVGGAGGKPVSQKIMAPSFYLIFKTSNNAILSARHAGIDSNEQTSLNSTGSYKLRVSLSVKRPKSARFP